jgi:hypothetical protein
MSARGEQLVLEYLSRVADAAHGVLRSDQRTRFVTRVRAAIEEQRREAGAAEPADVRRVLARFGDPKSLVERERRHLETAAAAPGPRSGAAGGAPAAGGAAVTSDAAGGAASRRLVGGGAAAARPGRAAGEHGSGVAAATPERLGAATAGGGAGPAGSTAAAVPSPDRPGDPPARPPDPAGAPAPDAAVSGMAGWPAGPAGSPAAPEVRPARFTRPAAAPDTPTRFIRPAAPPGRPGRGGGPAAPGAGPAGQRAPGAGPAGQRVRGAGPAGRAAGRTGAAGPLARVPSPAAPHRRDGMRHGPLQPSQVPLDLASLARNYRREVLALFVLGLGGVLLPFPLWLLGAFVGLTSKVWSTRDKLVGIAGPPVFTLSGIGVIGALNKNPSIPVDLHAYLAAAHADGGTLIRIGAFLGACYLGARLARTDQSARAGRQPDA